jgi:metal-responsive CopG/Arc/MetJ family transcriptional regulator
MHQKERGVRTPIYLYPPLIAALDRQAEAEGKTSRSAVVRRACVEYLGRHATGSDTDRKTTRQNE